MRREVYWFILSCLILFENLALVSPLVSPCSVWFWSVWVQDWVQEKAAGVLPARIPALLDYLRAMQLFQLARAFSVVNIHLIRERAAFLCRSLAEISRRSRLGSSILR